MLGYPGLGTKREVTGRSVPGRRVHAVRATACGPATGQDADSDRAGTSRCYLLLMSPVEPRSDSFQARVTMIGVPFERYLDVFRARPHSLNCHRR
jgi:hypothetical protein